MPAEMIAGAKRYAAFCEATGKTGSEYVMQAVRFLGPDKYFSQDWEQPREVSKQAQRGADNGLPFAN